MRLESVTKANSKCRNKPKYTLQFPLTSYTLCMRGSSHLTLHSQWLSRNVKTFAVAKSAPLTLDRTRPATVERKKEEASAGSGLGMRLHRMEVGVQLERTIMLKALYNKELCLVYYLLLRCS